MFGHGFGMLFLATVYNVEEDGDRREVMGKVLARAAEYTAKAQTSRGGWGYVAAADGGDVDEGACTIVQLQGLRAARNAGIVFPKKLIDIGYLRRSTTPRGGVRYSLSGGGFEQDRPALTAAALAGMLTAGEYDSDLARKWISFYQKAIPVYKPDEKMGHDEYMQYYFAQAMYILGDQGYENLFPDSKPNERLTWTNYRQGLFDSLLARQSKDGSWNSALGQVFATACYATIMQLDDGRLPIYQR